MNDAILSPQYLYDVRDDANRILRLQRILRTLSWQMRRPEWNTAENGVYDTPTRDAVRAFQTSYDLPETGTVDLRTWNLMRELLEHRAQQEPAVSPIQPFGEPGRRIEEGEYSDLVLLMQIMLNALRLYYDRLPPLPLSGRYDGMTAEALRIFRQVNGLPQARGVDAALWSRLAEEYSRIAAENQ